MTKTQTGRPPGAAGGGARSIDLAAIGKGRRSLELAPETYNATDHTVGLVLSEGAAVERWYGTEKLAVDEGSVITTRLGTSGILLIDSHYTGSISSVAGRMTAIWFPDGKFLGRAKFSET